MARNKNKNRKKITNRKITQLMRELSTWGEPTNPKAADAKFQIVREIAALRGERVQDIKKEFDFLRKSKPKAGDGT